jgi:hypothetical protein
MASGKFRGSKEETRQCDLKAVRAELQRSLAASFRHIGYEERAEHIDDVEFQAMLDEVVDDRDVGD